MRVAADRDAFARARRSSASIRSRRASSRCCRRRRTPARIDVRVPRAHFADFPRTELRLFASATPAPADAPELVVFYLGVPDTTPEFAVRGGARSAISPTRIARARAGTGSKTP